MGNIDTDIQSLSGKVDSLQAAVNKIEVTLSGLTDLSDLPNLTLTDASGNSVTVACMLCMLCGIVAPAPGP
jgi:hypothetical protein